MNRKMIRNVFAILVITVLVISMIGCTKASVNEVANKTTAPDNGKKEANASATDTAAPEVLGKAPMIEITTVRSIPDGNKFAAGETIDDNVWTKEEQEKLGIKVKNIWSVPFAQYDQKLNIAIASNDLPDFFKVNAIQLKNLVESGLVEDLTNVIKNYSSDILNKTVAEDRFAIKSATFGGKVMALPLPGSAGMGESNVWVRTDWLEKLKLSEPKTMDDLLAVAKAFIDNDPDGNGKKDTYGIGLAKDLFKTGLASLDGFFAGYHAYPNIWVKDASGKAAFGGIQPEAKVALAKLQELYKSGMFDKEFGVKDGGKVAESIGSNQIGLYYGTWWNPYYPLQDTVNKNPIMRWKAIPLVSTDANPVLEPGDFVTTGYYVVKKGAAHPEAIIKMANYLLTKYYVNNEVVALKGKYDGIAVWNYPALWIEPPTKNVAIQQRIKAAIESGDDSKLTMDDKNNYGLQKDFLDKNDIKQWQQYAAFGKEGSLNLVNNIISNNSIQYTLYNAAPSKTMIEKQSALDKLQLESFTKIIMGVSSVDSEFDKYVADWKKFGGDQITKEVNDWYEKNK